MRTFFFFFFTLDTGPRRALRLKLSDTRVHEPEIRTRLGSPQQRTVAVHGVRGLPRRQQWTVPDTRSRLPNMCLSHQK